MLVLQLRTGETTKLYDLNNDSQEYGFIKYLTNEDGVITLGIDLPKSIRILREKLALNTANTRRDSLNGKKHVS
jgi:sRNA-binding carbon storage regulator CsrA